MPGGSSTVFMPLVPAAIGRGTGVPSAGAVDPAGRGPDDTLLLAMFKSECAEGCVMTFLRVSLVLAFLFYFIPFDVVGLFSFT